MNGANNDGGQSLSIIHSVLEKQQKILKDQNRVLAGIKDRICLLQTQSVSCSCVQSSSVAGNVFMAEAPELFLFLAIPGCAALLWILNTGSKYFSSKGMTWQNLKQRELSCDEPSSECSPSLDQIEYISFREILRYRLEHLFSVSRIAKPALLLSLTFAIISQGTFALIVFTGNDIFSASWRAWTFVADSGTHASAKGTCEKCIGFFTSVAGMIIFALMIGVVTESLHSALESLKKGKARIIEAKHTLILGWSDKGMTIIQQVALANMSQGGKIIVVLCHEQKQDMQDMLKRAMDDKNNPLILHGSRVVFRQGNPLAEADLRKVSVVQASVIIVLSKDNLEPDAADSRMLRQVASLEQVIATSKGSFKAFVVAEVQEIDNRALIQMVGKNSIEVVTSRDLLGRLLLLAMRSPLTALVLEELMRFEGCELYTKEWKELVGQTFGSLRFRFESAVPVGVKLKDNRVLINPEDDFMINDDDSVIVLAEDDDTYHPNIPMVEYSQFKGYFRPGDIVDLDEGLDEVPEKVIFFGWRRDMVNLIQAFDDEAPPKSELWLFNKVPVDERTAKLLDKGDRLTLHLRNITIHHVVGDVLIRGDLLSMKEVSDGLQGDGLKAGEPTGRREMLNLFTSITILSEYGESEQIAKSLKNSDTYVADNRCIAATLVIRSVQAHCIANLRGLGIPCDFAPTVSEVIDPATRDAVQHSMDALSQGIILSNTLVASMLAMVSENRDAGRVLEELLSSFGNQIRIRRVCELMNVSKKEKLSFWDLSCIASMSREILIGYFPFSSVRRDKEHAVNSPGHETGDESSAPKVDSLPGPEMISNLPRTKDRFELQNSPEVILNPKDKSIARAWDPQDHLVLIGQCVQAKRKLKLRRERLVAEQELISAFGVAGPGRFPIHGWLRKLNSGARRENEMDDEDNWRDRLCFVMDGELAYVSEKEKGKAERVCRLADIDRIQAGNGWPPGFHTFKLDIRGSNTARVFAAASDSECRRWINALASLECDPDPS